MPSFITPHTIDNSFFDMYLFRLFTVTWFYLSFVQSPTAHGQAGDTTAGSPRKGSYLYFGQPRIEDNSMLLEEAVNQEKGFIQHISTIRWEDMDAGGFVITYSEEIPLFKDRHQISFILNYPVRDGVIAGEKINGFGDMVISYRPMIGDKRDWALVVPRATLILPTGDPQKALGDGAWGTELGLAVTKRISRRLISHYNVSYSARWKADRYFSGGPSVASKHYEKNLHEQVFGASVTYLAHKNFNFLLETQSLSSGDIEEDGRTIRQNTVLVNPAFRFAFDIGDVQVVPGFGVPLSFGSGELKSAGALIYLSLEPDHTR